MMRFDMKRGAICFELIWLSVIRQMLCFHSQALLCVLWDTGMGRGSDCAFVIPQYILSFSSGLYSSAYCITESSEHNLPVSFIGTYMSM